MSQDSAFVFCTCAAASNAWLKRELSREYPELRLAFSRPGLVTWKTSSADADFAPRTPVARVSGHGIGQAKGLSAVIDRLRHHSFSTPPFVHVFPLDAASGVGETESGLDRRQHLLDFEAELLASLPGRFADGAPRAGDLVLDVMLDPSLTPDAPAWLGTHLQRRDRPTTPGGVVACPLPVQAPSRAYAKLVELLALGELVLVPEQTAVEIGAAPGGGTLALMERGVWVTAIDPATLDPAVLAFRGPSGSRVRHLAIPAAEVQAKQLPKRVDLVVTDVNLAPVVSLRYVERLCKLGPPKLAILMTLKMNDAKVEAALPALLTKAEVLGARYGLTELRTAQLPSHRREVGVVLRRR